MALIIGMKDDEPTPTVLGVLFLVQVHAKSKTDYSKIRKVLDQTGKCLQTGFDNAGIDVGVGIGLAHPDPIKLVKAVEQWTRDNAG